MGPSNKHYRADVVAVQQDLIHFVRFVSFWRVFATRGTRVCHLLYITRALHLLFRHILKYHI